MKKLTIVLIAVLFVSMSLYADGVEPFGDGTEQIPYQITSLDNLLWLSTNNLPEGIHIIQISDIDASDTQNWNDGEGFKPICGFASGNFVGFYDGMNHTISNLYINRPVHYVGLFGKVMNGSIIENLTLIDANITGMWQVGALIGYCMNSTVINCASENGNISGGSYRVGGLIGEMGVYTGSGGTSELLFSYVTGTVFSTSEAVGGLVGRNIFGFIYNCFVSMDSIVGHKWVGGLVGDNFNGTISYCNSMAEVYGDNSSVGGLVGYNEYSSTISYCSSEGSVMGNQRVGGLVGENWANSYILNSYSTADVVGNWNWIGGFIGSPGTGGIRNCYSTGLVVANGYPGGFSGSCNNIFDNNFWDTETSGTTYGIPNGNCGGITGKTHEDMLNVATYTDTTTVGLETAWDFLGDPFDDEEYEDIWNIDGATNNGYPFFTDSTLTFVDEVISEIPKKHILKNNYPNPFNSNTNISFSIEEESNVVLIIIDFKGQKIKTLTNKKYSKGDYYVIWNGTDENNNTLSSGVYFYQLSVNYESVFMKKCIVLN